MTTQVARLSLLVLTLALLGGARPNRVQTIAIRPLGPITTISRDVFSHVFGVRPLPDGRVFVNDSTKRRLVLLDSLLSSSVLIAGGPTWKLEQASYGQTAGGLMAYRGDSTLFLKDMKYAESRSSADSIREHAESCDLGCRLGNSSTDSLIVIDPHGTIVRAITIPITLANLYSARTSGLPRMDAEGRLIFRVAPPRLPQRASATDSNWQPPPVSDSASIVRVDLTTYQVETLAYLWAEHPPVIAVSERAQIRTLSSTFITISGFPRDPFLFSDDWSLLPDGSIAIIRARDFHVDLLDKDGFTTSSSPRIAHEWKRLTDGDKVALLDSARRADSLAHPWLETPSYVPADVLPDYVRPFDAQFTQQDVDGNLWIRINMGTPIIGGSIYDVVNPKGELIDRVQIPGGAEIVGFERGVAYLTLRVDGGVKLARALIAR